MKTLLILSFVGASILIETNWPQKTTSLSFSTVDTKNFTELNKKHESELNELKNESSELKHTRNLLLQINKMFERLKMKNDPRRHAFLFYATKAMEIKNDKDRSKALTEWFYNQKVRIINMGPEDMRMLQEFDKLENLLNQKTTAASTASWNKIKESFKEKIVSHEVPTNETNWPKATAHGSVLLLLSLALYMTRQKSSPKRFSKDQLIQSSVETVNVETQDNVNNSKTEEVEVIKLNELPPPVPGIEKNQLTCIEASASFEEMIEKMGFIFQAGAWKINGVENGSTDLELLIDPQSFNEAIRNISLAIVKVAQISKASPALTWKFESRETTGTMTVRIANTGLTEPLIKHDYKFFKEDSILGHLLIAEDQLIGHEGKINYVCSENDLVITVKLERTPVVASQNVTFKENQNSSSLNI